MSDTRHRQLSRIYQRTIENDEDAREAIAANPGVLASALFLEAVESDDVTSVETGRAYAADRIAYLGDLIGEAEGAIREALEGRLRTWEQP